MRTFVALGDSTTAGFGDPHPDGLGWRGWAALLAEGLGPGVAFHNLATSGARTADVARRQLPAAVALRPHLATVLVGVNDTLRADFDLAAIAAALDHTIGTLQDAGAVLLTACLPDPGRMFRLPGALARPLGRRIRAVNAITHRVAGRHHALHLHIAHLPGVYDPRMWSIDRLHPGERGHRLLAGASFDLLAGAGFPVGRRPGAGPTSPPPSRQEQVRWMLTKGVQWLYARSTDLAPYLAAMAVAEWWHTLHGDRARLDERNEAAVAAVLARLSSAAHHADRGRTWCGVAGPGFAGVRGPHRAGSVVC